MSASRPEAIMSGHVPSDCLETRHDRGLRLAGFLSLATLAFIATLLLWAQQAALKDVILARGQVVAAPQTTTASGLYARVLLRESQLARLQLGQAVKIDLSAGDASGLEKLEGTLERVDKAPISQEGESLYYPAYIKIDWNPLIPNDLSLGVPIVATIDVGETTVMQGLLRPFLPGSDRLKGTN